MIKKISLYFVIIIMGLNLCTFAHGVIATLAVERVSWAAKTFVGSNLVAPVRVLAQTTTGAVAGKWMATAITPGGQAKIVVAVLGVAGALAADYLMLKGAAWWASKNITRDPDGTFQKTTTFTPSPPATTARPIDYGVTERAIRASIETVGYPNCSGAGLWIRFVATWAEVYPDGWKLYETNWLADDTWAYGKSLSGWACILARYSDSSGWHCVCSPLAGTQYVTAGGTVTKSTQSMSDIQSALTTDLAANNANARFVSVAAVDVVSQAINKENALETTNPAAIAAARAEIAAALTTTQTSALDAAAVAPDDTWATDQGVAAGTAALTQGQVKQAVSEGVAEAAPAAVKEAIDDETGLVPVVDPTIVIPTKLSLTTILNSFVTSIKSLPMFTTLNGLTINVSGATSQLCLALPANLGGTKCYDAIAMQSTLNMIGTVLLGLTSIFAFVGIFKG